MTVIDFIFGSKMISAGMVVFCICIIVDLYRRNRKNNKKRLEAEKLRPPFLDDENALYCTKLMHCFTCLKDGHYDCKAIKEKLLDKREIISCEECGHPLKVVDKKNISRYFLVY